MLIKKRLYRGVLWFLLFFMLAPMEDGCKYDNARANPVQNVAPPAPTLVPLVKGNR